MNRPSSEDTCASIPNTGSSAHDSYTTLNVSSSDIPSPVNTTSLLSLSPTTTVDTSTSVT